MCRQQALFKLGTATMYKVVVKKALVRYDGPVIDPFAFS